MYFQCIKGIATKKKYYGYSDVIPQSEYENLTDNQKNNFVPVDEGIEDPEEDDEDKVNNALTENLYGQGEVPEDDSSSFQFPTPDPDPNQTSFDFGGGESGGAGASGSY